MTTLMAESAKDATNENLCCQSAAVEWYREDHFSCYGSLELEL